MARKAKTPKVAGFMREIVAANLAALLAKHYAAMPNITQRQHAAAKEAGVSFSTIQRIMGKGTGATLDNLELIAFAFDLSPYQLLIPSLEAKNPQVVKGATEAERRLYAQWRKNGSVPTARPARKNFILEDVPSAESQRQRVR